MGEPIGQKCRSTFKNRKKGRLSTELILLETFGFRDILG